MNEPKLAIIDVLELQKRREENPDLCLIDVRELSEWQTIHIPGALHIPKDNLSQGLASSLLPSPDTPIYLHCRAGVRSLQAAYTLLELGYKEVYSIEGGIDAWAANGFQVTTSS